MITINNKYFFLILIIVLGIMPGFSYAAPKNQTDNFFIVELKNGSQSFFSADPNIKTVAPVFVENNSFHFKNTFKVDTLYSSNELLRLYGNNIVYVEPQKQVFAAGTITNDPGFTSDPSDINRQWALQKAHFTDAWDKTKGSSAVIVAVIDTGVDGTHEDLSAGQIGAGFNLTNRTTIGAGVNSDDNGHGTLISGIIAATPNNFRGIAGTNWAVTIMPLKALDATGSGNSADVAAAIVYAADHGANVINMSLGGTGFANDTTLSNAITYAFSKNVVIVAAAGNDSATNGSNLDFNPVFPVCDDNGQNMIIGVAASDINDQKAAFSDYGKACIDVSAPGKKILSTINHDPLTHAPTPNSYAYGSGTSLAAPFVSGEAALIKALYPQATNKEIRDRIIKSADPIDTLNPYQCAGASCAGLIGSGRINVFNALDSSYSVNLVEGTLVKADNSPIIYLFTNGQKEPVSDFVLQQRFAGVPPKIVPSYVLETIPLGPYAFPIDGTLVKTQDSPTVYQIFGGFKRPVTFQVWQQRSFQPSQLNILTETEMSSWLATTFLAPVEGTLVRDPSNPTVYFVIDGLLHPMNRQFYIDRGLQIFPIMILNGKDINGYAQGNAYIR